MGPRVTVSEDIEGALEKLLSGAGFRMTTVAN
jgi:hypothetical protein